MVPANIKYILGQVGLVGRATFLSEGCRSKARREQKPSTTLHANVAFDRQRITILIVGLV